MLARIRRRLTFANVTATLALLFAMSGGAYAASKYLITSTKQISPKVLKELKGRAGLAGPAGAPGKEGVTGKEGLVGKEGKEGAVGKEGAAGKEGSAGKEGPAGEGVTIKSIGSGASCKEGGSEFSNKSIKSLACNGATGFTKTLPAGDTETGAWQDFDVATTKTETAITISFPIPLESTATATPHYITLEAEESNKLPAGCLGSVEKPEAEKGNLCVFEANSAEFAGVEEPEFLNADLGLLKGAGGTAGPTGVVMSLKTAAKLELGKTVAWGSWAVTAN